MLNYKFNVQQQKKLRVIIDTDAACEALSESVNTMGNMRTMAFQVPSEMFDEINEFIS